MAISRPFLLALLGVLLLGVTYFAVTNARDNASDDAAPAAQSEPEVQQAAAPAEPAEPAADPQETLAGAFNLGKVDSTSFDASLELTARGQGVDVQVSGAFEKGAANDVPEFALDVEATVQKQTLQGGFVSVGEKAYFTQGEKGWALPAQIWDPVVQAVSSGQVQAQQQVMLGVNPMNWVKDVQSEGTETVGGVETEHVSATVDPKLVAKDLAGIARQSGAELPSPQEVARSVRTAELDAWVGDDDVLRRVSATLVLAGPVDNARSEINFDLELTGVNEPQSIEAPADVRQGMPGGAFGSFAEGLVLGLSSNAGGEPVSLAALTSPNPGKAAKAVRQGKQVVILFQNPNGLDDQLMERVMRQLDQRTRAVVLTDHVDAVDRYGKLVEDLGVSQTPAVVLIDSAGEARLLEGYVDTDTLAQAVADAR